MKQTDNITVKKAAIFFIVASLTGAAAFGITAGKRKRRAKRKRRKVGIH